ncbi:hypothetical protein RJ641_017520, partial [Dillenia turbinata]
RKPTSGGKHPDKLVLIRRSSCKVSAKFAILGGRQPPNLLLANTTTEALPLPKFGGITEVKSKELRRQWPFKLIEAKIKIVQCRKRKHNGRKRAYKSIVTNIKLVEKVIGRIPQKRLLFRWMSARSVRRPSSSGRKPAMLAKLRSMPATTCTFGSSRDGAQYTPV